MNDQSEYDKVKLKLNEKVFTFDDGKWHGENITNDACILLKEKQHLIEENNYLKLKVEVLLNMLAESSAMQQSRDQNK
ncbi:uncharacterized protein TNIN_168701 [Trichonephila inaurata madagascariensis]|uniref:Uncharacterized protein n=1 Tax=Trichonephila inaurata madagascariensis TaxID=2747483 RepID=A0A8X6I623_9ARAC|nr:uncharacterized protein TNIN_168701 [Trichonephila inaurata madagascariensis]